MARDSQYDAIAKKNIANILGKLKEGKTLTASDSRALENHRRKEEGLRPQQTEAELAKEFGVDRRGSIVRWKKLGAPLDGTNAEMYQWMLDKDIRGAEEWKKNYRAENPGQFTKKKATKKKAKKVGTKSAEELRDEYFMELQEAREMGDDAREKIALEYFLKIDKQIRDQEAHNKKLGLDSGEVLSRTEVERILQAMFWAGNACLDKFSKQIAQKLSDKKAPEIHQILKPHLTALTLFEALERVAKSPGGVNLPSWAIKKSKTEEKHYIELQ